ncbi:PilW family protein [Photobacterium leiognathi]|uniref:PilW family protein n=1 Tax=Photobacterium leiognathi TaxID=553611 RepID=UPI00273586A1|nr:prepilin-type N-terminal cleavage/methylation domain-containing protein [Photobacterium leiognathi]
MYNQKGFSLLELLISMSIGLIAIGIVGSLFLHGNKLAAERSKQLMLAQDMNDALRMLKEDVLRAGYNEGKGSSFIVSGASNIVTLSPSSGVATCLMYGFNDGYKDYFRSYYIEDNKLKIYSTSVSSATLVNGCSGGSSMLDENLLIVDYFNVYETQLSGVQSSTQLIKVDLKVSLFDGSSSVEKSFDVKIRNWQ